MNTILIIFMHDMGGQCINRFIKGKISCLSPGEKGKRDQDLLHKTGGKRTIALKKGFAFISV
jgi:hypothetical protein